MRIAYLSTFYPFRGGIAQFNASLFRELEKQHIIKAYTFSRQYPDFLFPGKTQYLSNDEKADVIPASTLLDSINPITYLSTAQTIKAFKPDLLIMKFWMSFFGPSLGTVAKLLPSSVKVVSILDNIIPHEKRFFDNIFTNFFIRQNDGFVVMSDSVKNDLLSLAPDAKFLRKDHPLYNHFGEKIDKINARNQLKLHPNRKTMLFFGFIRDYKGLDILLKAFGMLDDSYQLVIAGETYGSFDKYYNIINSLKNKDKVFVFNDYISDEQVPVFFSASDVCILPYKSATQSGITSIAYHFDVPLIATNAGGLKESVHHNETGLIVQLCDPESIAASIKDYFENQMSDRFINGIQKIKANLSWYGFANNIIDFTAIL